jgi:sugar phosphate isomerase/epimerase
MARLSVNETTTFRWSFEEDVSHYAKGGIPSIGVWRHKLSDCGQTKAAELIRQSGLTVSHLFWAGGFTGSDGHTFLESIADAADALRTASCLGARCLVLYSGARAGHTYNHARRLVLDALKELAPLASQLGVDLALEPMHPGCAAEFTFLTNLDETLAVLDAAGCPAVKVVLDTYHLGFDAALIERIPEITPRIALVQLGDGRSPPEGEQNRCRLGQGIIPLKRIVAALSGAGYDGYYDVELLGEEFGEPDYLALLAHAKQAFEELLGRQLCWS